MKKILVVGDLFPSSVNEKLFIDGKVNDLFDENILRLFKEADISVCNLEGTLTLSNRRTPKLGPNIKANPDVLSVYKKIGVSLLATANNHITDFLQEGYIDTQKAIEKYGFDYIGSGRSLSNIKKWISYNLGDSNVCIYNVAETMFNVPTEETAGVNLYDEYLVCKEIEGLKKTHDIVIVIYHGGTEYFPLPTLELKKRFHRMADSGADLILAQHTHCIGCAETYNGAFLLYGQGNFLFDRSSSNEITNNGLAIEIVIHENHKIEIQKHFVHCTNGCINYVKNPDMSVFDERSCHVSDDKYLVERFKDFVMTQKSIKTKQFMAHKWYDSIVKKILSPSMYRKFELKYRKVKFSRPQLMRILYTVKSEQQKETAYYMVLRELENMGIRDII